MKIQAFIFGATVALAAAAPHAANADGGPAYTFTTAPVSAQGDLSLGFTFTANVNFDVTSLGYYDDQANGNGFLSPHEVGIFAGDGADGPGALLASTTLAAGTSGTLGPNDFRYQAITLLALVAGDTYTIAGVSGSPVDPWIYGGPSEVTGFAVNPDVTIPVNAARYLYTSAGLVDPPDHYSDYQFYAVNFNGPVSSVPEPSTWAMILLGFAVLGVAGYRRSKVAAKLAAA